MFGQLQRGAGGWPSAVAVPARDFNVGLVFVDVDFLVGIARDRTGRRVGRTAGTGGGRIRTGQAGKERCCRRGRDQRAERTMLTAH